MVPPRRHSSCWLPAGEDIVPGPEFCPEAVINYAHSGKKRPWSSIVLDVRKHLSHLNWKIEFLKDPTIRLRYTSPLDGKQYYSLRDVCSVLVKHIDTNLAPLTMEQQEHYAANDTLLSKHPASSLSERQNSFRDNDAVFIEPEYCPEAVVEWYKIGLLEDRVKINNRKESVPQMTLKAKKHLSFLGWSFRYVNHCGRRELRYVSPDGKQHNSLRVACRYCMNTSGQQKTVKEQSNFSRVESVKLQNCNVQQEPKSVSVKSQSKVRNRRITVQQDVVANPSPRTIITWLIDNEVLLPREKVYYCSSKGRPSMAKGYVSQGGIKCFCCGKEYTLSGFESHVIGKCSRPAAHIFLKDGRSLLDCLMKIVYNEKKSVDVHNWQKHGNDEICSVCHYGGELILCDQCPSAFHKTCIGLVDVPDGDWFCPLCCCGICNQNELKGDDNGFQNCAQCERKYHVGCIKTRVEDISNGNWFCGKKCEEIFLGLHELLGKPIPVGVNNLTWTLLKYKHPSDHIPDASDVENYSMLSIALNVMHECFKPVKDPNSKGDILKDVIFSKKSELNRLNFQGFYTVLLQKDDEFITVATVRVYGEKVAELPLVGTRAQYRRLGMCGILMNVLEKKLEELGVQRLILPAVPSLLNTWTGSFGFSKLIESERLQFLDYTFLDFEDTIMCQKLLTKIPSAESSPPTEAQTILDGDASGNDDAEAHPILDSDASGNVDAEAQPMLHSDANGNAEAVSEVSQADKLRDEIMEYAEVVFAASNSSSSNEETTNPVARNLKCYKRQRKSLVCGC